MASTSGRYVEQLFAAQTTTGTWKHYLRYEPLEDGAVAVPAF